MLNTPATTKSGARSGERRVRRGRDRGGGDRQRDPDRAQRAQAAPEPVGDSSRTDPGGDGEHVDRREQRSGGMCGHVAVLMEEEHDEARDADLRDEIKPGAGAE